ncbi:helix-turn-helix domain-containing protein [Paenibacillus sp. FSL R10-2199]|uniref:helix-turn-helix domain-containing protein n=1 Tax=Paenibacillus sp. FSL R10-2199 TaxID=2975348 RepID=UPI0030F8D2B8
MGIKLELKELREQRNLSVDLVAQKTGIQVADIKAFEKHPFSVGLILATSFSILYNVSLDEINWN